MLHFSFFNTEDGRPLGNVVLNKWLSAPNYNATADIKGFPVQYSILAAKIVTLCGAGLVRVLIPLLLMVSLLAFLLIKKDDEALLISLPFILVIGYFGNWNLSSLGLIFLLSEWLYAKNGKIIGTLVFGILAVNVTPFAFPFAMYIFCRSGAKAWFLPLLFPIQFYLSPFLGFYYQPSLFYYLTWSPFSIVSILLAPAYVLARTLGKKSNIRVYALLLISILEPLTLPFVFILLITEELISFRPKLIFAVLSILLIMVFWNGVPLGRGKVHRRNSPDLFIYGDLVTLYKMPHYGRIFNFPVNGPALDAVLFPRFQAARIPFSRQSISFTDQLSEILTAEGKMWARKDTGVIVLPVSMIFNRSSLFYKISSSDNWLLTYMDGDMIVLDRDHELHIIMFRGPYLFQMLLRGKPLTPYEKEEIWEYVESLGRDYRDEKTFALSYLTAVLLENRFIQEGIKKQMREYAGLRLNMVMAMTDPEKLPAALAADPYNPDLWKLAGEVKGGPLFFGIEKILRCGGKEF